ncbi:MAG: hypothetical protein COZ57_28800, partial [Armatimonadetes bacterium CG_4_8_14_3_um_filter_66_20]
MQGNGDGRGQDVLTQGAEVGQVVVSGKGRSHRQLRGRRTGRYSTSAGGIHGRAGEPRRLLLALPEESSMPLVTTKPLVDKAFANGYAIAAMNSNGGNYDIMRACLETAQEMRAPFIINCYAKNARYAGMGFVAHSARWLINQFAPDIPVAIHLDHGQTFADCVDAVRAGFTSIMCDGSDLPLEENLALTQKVVEIAQAVGVSVEAELGQLLHG